jgi:hypothetical protein
MLVVEPDYLPDSEVFFSAVFIPHEVLYTPEECTLFHVGECRGGLPPLRGPGASGPPGGLGGPKPPKEKLPCKSIL